MRTNQAAITVAGQTAGTAESEVCCGLIEVYLVIKQSQNQEKVASAAEGKGGFMPINRAQNVVLRPGSISAPGIPETAGRCSLYVF
jgi:hypothetical protein